MCHMKEFGDGFKPNLLDFTGDKRKKWLILLLVLLKNC